MKIALYDDHHHQGIGPLQDGERAAIEIDGIGRLEFGVSDPLKRRWPKGIDEVSAKDLREGRGRPGTAGPAARVGGR